MACITWRSAIRRNNPRNGAHGPANTHGRGEEAERSIRAELTIRSALAAPRLCEK